MVPCSEFLPDDHSVPTPIEIVTDMTSPEEPSNETLEIPIETDSTSTTFASSKVLGRGRREKRLFLLLHDYVAIVLYLCPSPHLTSTSNSSGTLHFVAHYIGYTKFSNMHRVFFSKSHCRCRNSLI